jgi:hypothetical protein
MEQTKKFYPNYLTEVVRKSQMVRRSPSNNYDREVARVRAILGSQSLNQANKMAEVKSAVDKMSFTYQPNRELSDDEQMNRLRAKVKLLEILQ